MEGCRLFPRGVRKVGCLWKSTLVGTPPWMIENGIIFNEMSIRNPSFFFLSQFLACRPNREGNQGKVEVRSQSTVKCNGLRASRLKRVTFDILKGLFPHWGVVDYSPGGFIPPGWRLRVRGGEGNHPPLRSGMISTIRFGKLTIGFGKLCQSRAKSDQNLFLTGGAN